jgi:predicted nucleotidyltransferase
VDFLIETGENVTPWFPGGLIADLEELLGRRVDVAEPDVLHPLVREHVLAEADTGATR